MTYTKEKIDSLDKDALKKYLNRITKNPKLNQSLQDHPELHPEVDLLANELLWVEDRIRYLEQVEFAHLASAVRYGKIVAE